MTEETTTKTTAPRTKYLSVTTYEGEQVILWSLEVGDAYTRRVEAGGDYVTVVGIVLVVTVSLGIKVLEFHPDGCGIVEEMSADRDGQILVWQCDVGRTIVPSTPPMEMYVPTPPYIPIGAPLFTGRLPPGGDGLEHSASIEPVDHADPVAKEEDTTEYDELAPYADSPYGIPKEERTPPRKGMAEAKAQLNEKIEGRRKVKTGKRHKQVQIFLDSDKQTTKLVRAGAYLGKARRILDEINADTEYTRDQATTYRDAMKSTARAIRHLSAFIGTIFGRLMIRELEKEWTPGDSDDE